MQEKQIDFQCPVETVLKMIGGKYKTLILWHLLSGSMRNGEIHRKVPKATPKMLTQQLRELEVDGLINRTVYAQVPPKVEYSLTELGISLKPILQMIYEWGADYMKSNGKEICCSMKKLK